MPNAIYTEYERVWHGISPDHTHHQNFKPLFYDTAAMRALACVPYPHNTKYDSLCVYMYVCISAYECRYVGG